MRSDLIRFFSVQRQIFGVCTCCDEIFRLSDTNIFIKERPTADWLDKIHQSDRRLDRQEDKIQETESEIREIAREKGRRAAARSTRKIDTIFHPNKFDPDDAKVVFHPVDFLIFNGMKKKSQIDKLVLFDRQVRKREQKSLQKSIEKTIERENYEWITMQVQEDGSIEYK